MILATLIACFIAPLFFLGAFVWYMIYVANNHKNNNMGKYFDDEDEDDEKWYSCSHVYEEEGISLDLRDNK